MPSPYPSQNVRAVYDFPLAKNGTAPPLSPPPARRRCRCRLSLRSCLCSFCTSYVNLKNSYFKNAKTKTSTSFKTIKSAITIPIPECKSSLRLPAREKRHRSTSIAAACASPIRCRLSLRSCLCSRAKKNSIF